MSNEKDVSKELTDAVNKVLSRRDAVKKAGSIAAGAALAFLGLGIAGVQQSAVAGGCPGCTIICGSSCSSDCADNCELSCTGCSRTCWNNCVETCNECTGCTGSCAEECADDCSGNCSGTESA